MRNKSTKQNSFVKGLMPVFTFVVLLASCSKEKTIPPPDDTMVQKESLAKVESTPGIPTYSFTSTAASELMFEDGESMSTMTSEDRRIEFSKLLRIRPVNNTTVEIANFAPVDITDATVLMYISGRSVPIQLFNIGTVKAHRVQTIQYPFISGQTSYPDNNGTMVSLSQYKSSGISPSSVSFDYKGTSTLIQRLKKAGEMKWKFKPTDLDTENVPDSYKDTPTPKDFRKFTAVLVNMAYLYSSATGMKTAFLNEPITGNDGMLLSTSQKQTAYGNFVNVSNLKIGISESAQGVAVRGLILTIAPWVINDCLYATQSTFTHEMGHVIGFNHSSSMTYPSSSGEGSVTAARRIWQPYLTNGTLPVTLNNYYKADDFTSSSSASTVRTTQKTEECGTL